MATASPVSRRRRQRHSQRARRSGLVRRELVSRRFVSGRGGGTSQHTPLAWTILSPGRDQKANQACSTVATFDRRPVFANHDLAGAIRALLLERGPEATGVRLYAGGLMPDHLHLLLSPSEALSIIRLLQDSKSRSTRVAWGFGLVGRIWQSSFYDHFLRTDEDIQVAVQYILNNPVRASLVEAWRDYPFCGSNVFAVR